MIGATAPAAAANVFWPFGFYFPDKAHHRAGGLSAATPTVRLAVRDLPERYMPVAQRGGAADPRAGDRALLVPALLTVSPTR